MEKKHIILSFLLLISMVSVFIFVRIASAGHFIDRPKLSSQKGVRFFYDISVYDRNNIHFVTQKCIILLNCDRLSQDTKTKQSLKGYNLNRATCEAERTLMSQINKIDISIIGTKW